MTPEQLTILRKWDSALADLSREWGIHYNTLNAAKIGRTYKWFNSTVAPIAPLTPKQQRQRASDQQTARQERLREERKQHNDAADRNVQRTASAQQEQRRIRAIAEGGTAELTRLEALLKQGEHITEEQWALLHRLRIGLRPRMYAAMRAGYIV